ncbi:MAG: hypothetical protein HUU55_03435 [Myxococcales bacterium]|nr:hypothetical protein [Myxococcales bacterium]
MKLEHWIVDEILRKERNPGDFRYVPLYLELPNLVEPPPSEAPCNDERDDTDDDEDGNVRPGVIIIDIS